MVFPLYNNHLLKIQHMRRTTPHPRQHRHQQSMRSHNIFILRLYRSRGRLNAPIGKCADINQLPLDVKLSNIHFIQFINTLELQNILFFFELLYGLIFFFFSQWLLFFLDFSFFYHLYQLKWILLTVLITVLFSRSLVSSLSPMTNGYTHFA